MSDQMSLGDLFGFSDETPSQPLPSTPPSGETLEEARQRLRASLDEGIHCPCCSQYAKRYKRSLYKGYVHWLIWLVEQVAAGEEWADVRDTPKHLGRNGDYAKLQWWGFVESAGKRSRMWRPTREGLAFVKGRTRVPKYVFVYDNTVEGFSADTVSVHDVLADRNFDYDTDILAPTLGFEDALPYSHVEYTSI